MNMDTVALIPQTATADNSPDVMARKLDAEPRLLWLLPADEYRTLSRIADVLGALTSAKSTLAACAQAAGYVGLGVKQLYRRVRDYIRSHDWRCLVNRAKCSALWQSDGVAVVPATTREWWVGLFEKHKRSGRSAYNEALYIVRNRMDWSSPPRHLDAIPGYAAWPEMDARVHHRHPRGWSYANFMTACKRASYGAAAAREGVFAASEYRVPLLTTRTGLRLGERVEFDDHKFDVKIHYAGQSRAMCPVCFGAVDGLSTFVDLVIRPMLWDDDMEMKRELTEQQFRYFVLHWLGTHGYRTDERGTTLFVENAKAAIREEFAGRLLRETGGKVKVARGAMFAEAAHAGQFRPRGKGNFRFKALVEGFWNLLENRLDRLPGQTGSNARLNGPAELHGREEYLRRLLDFAEAAPAELAARVKLPVMTYTEFRNSLFGIVEAILEDREHALEGWDELNFHRVEFRPEETARNWYPIADLERLPSMERALVSAKLGDPALALTRSVKHSRDDVWKMFHTELTRITPHQYCRLLDERDAVEVTVGRQGLIEFEDRARFGHQEFRFLARGAGLDLRAGEKFRGWFNPLTARWLHLTNFRNQHVALLQPWDQPGKHDTDAVRRQMGRQIAIETADKDRLAARHHDDAGERAHLVEHNARVMEDARAETTEELERRALAESAAAAFE